MQTATTLSRNTALILSALTLVLGIGNAFAPAATPLVGAESAIAVPPGGDDDDLDDLEIQR